MIIKFKLTKTHAMESIPVQITVGNTSLTAYCPKEPLADWAMRFGSGYSPLFYEDQSPILGNYKLNRGNIICQLLYDLNNKRVVSEFMYGPKGMHRLVEIVPTKIAAGKTLFK